MTFRRPFSNTSDRMRRERARPGFKKGGNPDGVVSEIVPVGNSVQREMSSNARK